MPEVESMDEHAGFESGFEVKTDNDQILSIGRYYVNTVGSSSTTMKYDTVDKINGIMITLPSLFKNDDYIEQLNTYLTKALRAEMKKDESKI